MDELAKRFADLAEKYGPNVADAAMQAARIEAYSCLAASLMWLGVSGLLIYTSRMLWRKAVNGTWDEEYACPASIFVLVIGGLTGLVAIWVWIDPWTWTTISHPELWIAKKAFKI